MVKRLVTVVFAGIILTAPRFLFAQNILTPTPPPPQPSTFGPSPTGFINSPPVFSPKPTLQPDQVITIPPRTNGLEYTIYAPTGPTPTGIQRVIPQPSDAALSPTPLHISNISHNLELKGKMYIEFAGPLGTQADVFAIIPSNTQNKLLIGTSTVDSTSGRGTVLWNTTDVPNGPYFLVLFQNGVNLPDPIPVTVMNPVAPNITPATQKQLIFPDKIDITKVPVSPKTSVEAITNVTEKDKATGIKISGKSEPNTLITVFIYSNPIVVTVKTDANGVWTYTLEKPLEPGEHTTYAVVAQADGTAVRSEIANFKVAQVSAAEPGQASLQLESSFNRQPYVVYGVATFMLIAGGIFILILMYRRMLSKNQAVNLAVNPLLDPPPAKAE